MKKLFLIAVIATMFASCTKTNEQLIEQGLNEYVQFNFADPNSLREVVKIEALDTINYPNLKENLELISKLLAGQDTLLEQFMLIETKLMSKAMDEVNKYSAANDYKFKSLIQTALFKLVTHTNYKPNTFTPQFDEFKAQYEEIISAETTTNYPEIIEFSVKFRTENEDGKLEINEMYGYLIKNGEQVDVKILPKYLTIKELKEYSPNLSKIYELTTEGTTIYDNYKADFDETKEAVQEFVNYATLKK